MSSCSDCGFPFAPKCGCPDPVSAPVSVTKAKANNVREALLWLQVSCEVKGFTMSARHAEVLASLNDDKMLADFYDILKLEDGI